MSFSEQNLKSQSTCRRTPEELARHEMTHQMSCAPVASLLPQRYTRTNCRIPSTQINKDPRMYRHRSKSIDGHLFYPLALFFVCSQSLTVLPPRCNAACSGHRHHRLPHRPSTYTSTTCRPLKAPTKGPS